MKRLLLVILGICTIGGCSLLPYHSEWYIASDFYSGFNEKTGRGIVAMSHRYEPTDPNREIDGAFKVAQTHCLAYGYSGVTLLEKFSFDCIVGHSMLTGEAYCEYYRTSRHFQCN